MSAANITPVSVMARPAYCRGLIQTWPVELSGRSGQGGGRGGQRLDVSFAAMHGAMTLFDNGMILRLDFSASTLRQHARQ